MASDIWQRYEVKKPNECIKLRPTMFIWWFAMIFFTSHVESKIVITPGPSSDFKAHSLIRPQLFHPRNKREIINTRINKFEHVDDLTINVQINGIQHTLDLRLNTDLIPPGYKQTRQYGGNSITEIPQKVELCHYQGSIRDIPNSWAALSTCRGLQGVIYDSKNLHYIHSAEDSLNSIHYLYKDSDLILSNKTCGSSGTLQIKSINKRSANEAIPAPYNANSGSRYLELVLVVDTKIYIDFSRNINEVYHHCKDLANIINALYTPLNIFIALVGVEVWTDSDKILITSDSSETLTRFLLYRKEKLGKKMPNDNAQLLTAVRFEGSVVGKAAVGSICTSSSSGGVNTDHSKIVGLVAATVAHEMGHNFGMSHDDDHCSCPKDTCIMGAALVSTAPTDWSFCSLEQLSLAFSHGMDYCLRNKPKKLFYGPSCGNGFVEPGEQCDCGLVDNCDNLCCNAATCRLHSNATCATGECCDLNTCKLKNQGSQCRSADRECDLPEFCTGYSEYCPNDVFQIDGNVCKMGQAFCYQGTCKTHGDQCKLLWGPSGRSSELSCYELNEKGSHQGNCGYDALDSRYTTCDKRDVLCGMLQCQHLSGMGIQFGVESAVNISHSYVSYGFKVLSCKSAIVDLGVNEMDPGMVPNGAKCAEGRMCVNQRCMSVGNYAMTLYRDSACLRNCSGNGVCNSLGHCHCDKGFRPPECLQPGVGGSDDSGPPGTLHDENNSVATTLYIIFLGIVPIITLILLGIWYKRKNSSSSMWNKVSTYVSSIKCFQSIRNSFVPRETPVTNEESSKVCSLSDELPKNNLRITDPSFVSTTNPEAMRFSKNIKIDRSAVVNDSYKDTQYVNLSDKKCQRPIMNCKQLRVNTQSKLQQPDKSPSCSTSNKKVPHTAHNSECVDESNSEIYIGFKKLETIYRDTGTNSPNNADNQSQTLNKTYFYNKKPPPPPPAPVR